MCSFSIKLCGCRDCGTIVYTRSGSDWIDWFNVKMITYMSRSTAPFVSGLNSSSIYIRLDRIPRSTWARPGKAMLRRDGLSWKLFCYLSHFALRQFNEYSNCLWGTLAIFLINKHIYFRWFQSSIFLTINNLRNEPAQRRRLAFFKIRKPVCLAL